MRLFAGGIPVMLGLISAAISLRPCLVFGADMTAFADSFPVTPFLVFCFVIGFIQIQAAARAIANGLAVFALLELVQSCGAGLFWIWISVSRPRAGSMFYASLSKSFGPREFS
ncbi:hypothetical protein U1Q18_004550 [Sarracenia purpurea var. burkii]